MNTADIVSQLEQEAHDDERYAQAMLPAHRQWLPDVDQVLTADDNPRTVATGIWSSGIVEHIARHDPDRVLRGAAARRAILRMYHNAVAAQQAGSASSLTRAADRASVSILGDVIHLLAGHTPPGWED